MDITVTACSLPDYTKAVEHLKSSQTQPVSFLQAPFYGQWQTADGKAVTYYQATQGTKLLACGLFVRYDAPGGMNFLYSPYGPVTHDPTVELYYALQAFARTAAKQSRSMFVRFDNVEIAALSSVKTAANSVASVASLQPRAEWVLDISQPEDVLLAGMHKHARYNIRLAERANARYELYQPSQAPLDVFYDLMQTTSSRDTFSIMSKSYYKAILDTLTPITGFMAICYIDDKPAAAGLFILYDKQIHYVFAGSSNDFRKIAPPYFLIWNSILAVKKLGYTHFNFGGISDNVKSTHLSGVTSFKKRFGGYQVDHPNPIDVVCRPFQYSLFRIYKALRNR